MCKLYLQHNKLGPGGKPFSFLWRDNWYLIINCYTYEIRLHDQRWYRSMGLDPYIQRYRCSTDNGMDCDLVQDQGQWVLERVWD